MLHVIRGMFVVLCGVIGWWFGEEYQSGFRGLGIGLALSTALVILERFFARRFIAVISVLMFGVLIGFVLSHFVIAAIYLVPAIKTTIFAVDLDANNRPLYPGLAFQIEFAVTFMCVAISVIAILHTKDDLKFVIPFVELKREGGGSRPVVVDTSAIIDGRIAEVLETRILDSAIIVPRFVLLELQKVADSQDSLKRQRGRRRSRSHRSTGL